MRWQLHPQQCPAKTVGGSGGSCLKQGLWWPALSLSSLSCLDEVVVKLPAQCAGLQVALLQGQALQAWGQCRILVQTPALPSGLGRQLQ